MFVIPSKGRNKEAAWRLIEYMTSAKVSVGMSVSEEPGGVPALREGAAAPIYQKPYWQFVSSMLASPNAMPPPKIPLYDKLVAEVSRLEDFVLSGAKPSEGTATQMQERLQAEIDEVFAMSEARKSGKSPPPMP